MLEGDPTRLGEPEATSPGPAEGRDPSTSVPGGIARLSEARHAPRRRRPWFRWAVLCGLLGLTAWNATHSAALERSRDAEQRAQFVAALQNALDHLSGRPWSNEARLRAARCLSRLDHPDLAENHYQHAWQPSLQDLHYRAYGLVRANRRDRAVEAYRDILRRSPGDLTALRMLGAVLLSQSRWSEVLDVSRRIRELGEGEGKYLKPLAAGLHWTLWPARVGSIQVLGHSFEGMVHHNRFESERAARSLETVLALDPELESMPLAQPVFWEMLAEDLLKLGRSKDVIQRLAATSVTNADPRLLDLLGRAHLQQSATQEAERCWRAALAIDPANYDTLMNLGRLELRRGQPEAALGHLEAAARKMPRSYEAAYSLSLAYRQLGREDEARRQQDRYEQLRRASPEEPHGMGATVDPGRPMP